MMHLQSRDLLDRVSAMNSALLFFKKKIMTVPIPLLSDDPRRLQIRIVSPSLQIRINQSDQMLQYMPTTSVSSMLCHLQIYADEMRIFLPK